MSLGLPLSNAVGRCGGQDRRGHLSYLLLTTSGGEARACAAEVGVHAYLTARRNSIRTRRRRRKEFSFSASGRKIEAVDRVRFSRDSISQKLSNTASVTTSQPKRHHDDTCTPPSTATTTAVAKQNCFITTTALYFYHPLVWIRSLILGTGSNQHVEIGHQ